MSKRRLAAFVICLSTTATSRQVVSEAERAILA